MNGGYIIFNAQCLFSVLDSKIIFEQNCNTKITLSTFSISVLKLICKFETYFSIFLLEEDVCNIL